MELIDKIELYSKIRNVDNIPTPPTYENILNWVIKEHEIAMDEAEKCGIRKYSPDSHIFRNAQVGGVTVDVLIKLAHAYAGLSDDSITEHHHKLFFHIVKGNFIPVLLNYLFLEIVNASKQGEEDTLRFIVKFCYLKDEGNNLEEIAKTIYIHMNPDATIN